MCQVEEVYKIGKLSAGAIACVQARWTGQKDGAEAGNQGKFCP